MGYIKAFRSLKENLVIELKRKKGIIPSMKKDRRDNMIEYKK